MEGASIFDVGIPRPSFRRPPPLLLFYSRRIGLAKGRAIPILGGGKMTGKIGPYGIGILNVLTNPFKSDEFVIGQPQVDEPRTKLLGGSGESRHFSGINRRRNPYPQARH